MAPHWPYVAALTACVVGTGCPYISPGTHRANNELDLLDADGDGILASLDCDDGDPDRYPGADEACDGLDNNCNDIVDEGFGAWFTDLDLDRFGRDEVDRCAPPADATRIGGDCDDTNADIFPGQQEFCDGVDNDCAPTTGEAGVVTLRVAESGTQRNVNDELDTAVSGVWWWADSAETATLTFCSGEYDITLAFANNATTTTIRGRGGPTLRPGALDDRVVYADHADLILDGLNLTTGARRDGGGAILCNDSAITATNIDLTLNSAPSGGAIYASGCAIDASDLRVAQNEGVSASALWFANNTTADFLDVDLRDNTGGTAVTLDNSHLTMTSGSIERSSELAVLLLNNATFTGAGVDFAGNAPDLQSGNQVFSFGLNTSLDCGPNGCSTSSP